MAEYFVSYMVVYGDDYSYDKDGDLVSNCYDCPMNPDSDAWMR